MPKMFVLCGHNRCGTTWIREAMKTVHSVRLFSTEDVLSKYSGYFIDVANNDPHILFFHCPYAIQNPDIIAKLRQIDAGMAAIIIYREPIAAMVSIHTYQRWGYEKGLPGGPKGQLLFDQHIRDKDVVESFISGKLREQFEATYRYDTNALILRGNFPHYLELLYEDLEGDEEQFFLRILNFMNIKTTFTLPSERINQSMSVRSLFANKVIIKAFYLATGIDGSLLRRLYRNKKLRKSIFRFLMNLNSKPSQFLSNSEKDRMREITGPMVTEFSTISELDLSPWGYEDKSDSVV